MTVHFELPALFVPGWAEAYDRAMFAPAPVSPPAQGGPVQEELNIYGPQIGLRNKVIALRARRRVNRAFRRSQHEFEAAMDAVAHDPASQRELEAIWTTRG